MKLFVFITMLFSVDALSSMAQCDSMRITFWNVENLFYPTDLPDKLDDGFTPEGDHHWTWYRYNDKLKKVAKTLIVTGGWNGPHMIGLCEIESCYVLEDLISRTPLSQYNYIHRDSRDARGIDVALLYDTSRIEIIKTKWIDATDGSGTYTTRDILRADATDKCTGDSISVYINHWPSRYSGHLASEPRRLTAAERLTGDIDSNMTHNIIICGDFNDHPYDESLKLLSRDAELDNLMDHMTGGTHKYAGEWGILDMFLVGSGFRGRTRCKIFRGEWLLENENRHLGQRPRRTYQGPVYKGGYSDHLPIVLTVASKIKSPLD